MPSGRSVPSTLPGASSDHYEPCIDGWRAVAVLLVLVAHFFPLREFPNSCLQFGQAGVTIFFIISGYLISLVLLRSRVGLDAGQFRLRDALRQFYLRRLLRIAPAYYASILTVLLLGASAVLDHLGWLVTYTTNFGIVFQQIDFGNASHFWTLAVEEQFYLVWPFVLSLVPPRHLASVIRILFAGSLIFIVGAGCLGGSLELLTLLPIGGSSLALAYGAWLAVERFSGRGENRSLLLFSIGVGLPLFVCSQFIWWRDDGFPATSLGFYRVIYPWASVLFFGGLFQLSLRRRTLFQRCLTLPPLRYLGRMSYGLYLYHYLFDPYYYSIWSRLGIHGPLTPWQEGILKSLTALVLAAASWHGFEKPILNLKHRWAPGWQKAQSPT